jgi:hypothetical protein
MFDPICISFRCGIAVTLSILTAWGLASTAFGQTDNWLNPNGGNYEDGSNWSLGVPGDYPVFNLGSSGYTITLNQNDRAVDPYIETDNPILNLNSFTYTEQYLDVCTAAGTNGSLTLLGPGTLDDFEGALPSYIDVGSGSSTGNLIVNGATVDQGTPDSSISTAAGSTLTVENGGSVEQTHSPDQTMNLGGNLIVNDGTVLTQATMNLGSATIANGASVYSDAGSANAMNVSGDVVVDGSSLGAFGNVQVDPSASLTLVGSSQVNTQGSLSLNGIVDIVSGQVEAVDMTSLDAAVIIQLNANMIGSAGSPFFGGAGIAIGGGTLDITLPDRFAPALGERFQLFDYTHGPITGTFDSVRLPSLNGGESWATGQLYTTGFISIVPEPTSIALVLAAGGLLFRRRRQKN